MVAEHGSDAMTMNTFMDTVKDLETAINAQDPVASRICELFKMINNGFQLCHKHVTDIYAKLDADDIKQHIINLDQATQQINGNLQALGHQVAQHQAAQGPQQQSHHYKKGFGSSRPFRTLNH